MSIALTVHQTVFSRFCSAREFTVMQVMSAINQQLQPCEHLTVQQVSCALSKMARTDDRLRQMAAGRYAWCWTAQARATA